ncbi:hypothetical protein CPLU01_05721 [Colletotrichum plurivorum]|uniref:Uncharacterized protein n=1 Tax=Colletotrichum plurivorum TaxID=2175906 RepID=A0A8H6KKI3_9PEZI|nr:hypothetical protein CPLU01_05721 [Colletotrichum plurivorum]
MIPTMMAAMAMASAALRSFFQPLGDKLTETAVQAQGQHHTMASTRVSSLTVSFLNLGAEVDDSAPPHEALRESFSPMDMDAATMRRIAVIDRLTVDESRPRSPQETSPLDKERPASSCGGVPAAQRLTRPRAYPAGMPTAAGILRVMADGVVAHERGVRRRVGSTGTRTPGMGQFLRYCAGIETSERRVRGDGKCHDDLKVCPLDLERNTSPRGGM